MQLLDALRRAPRAIQRRGETLYEVTHRAAVGSAACYIVKRYPTTQITGPIIRALAELAPLLAFLHHHISLDPAGWEPAAPAPARAEGPTLSWLLQHSPAGSNDSAQ
jgi:hypothetical protein